MMRLLNAEEANALLAKYGIPLPKQQIAKTKDQAIKAAAILKFPVAMKVVSEKIVHKTDIGGVMLNINSNEEVEKAFFKLIKLKGAKAVLVQKMYNGNSVIIGMKRDKQFGPVIAFGLGGIFVEILKDIAFRIAPLSEKDATEMMQETKGYAVLQGARGSEKANIAQLSRILLSLSKLALENPKIQEIDLNPIIVNSKEAVAVDARIMVE